MSGREPSEFNAAIWKLISPPEWTKTIPARIWLIMIIGPIIITALAAFYLFFFLPPSVSQPILIAGSNKPIVIEPFIQKWGRLISVFPPTAQTIFHYMRFLPGLIALLWLPNRSKAHLVIIGIVYVAILYVVLLVLDVFVFCSLGVCSLP